MYNEEKEIQPTPKPIEDWTSVNEMVKTDCNVSIKAPPSNSPSRIILQVLTTLFRLILVISSWIELLILLKIIYRNIRNWQPLRYSNLRREGGSGVKKTSLAYIKVQPVMELLLFTELQNLRLWPKYGASKFGGITQSHTKYRGVKWPKTAILDQYFQKYLSLSVQTWICLHFCLQSCHCNFVWYMQIRDKCRVNKKWTILSCFKCRVMWCIRIGIYLSVKNSPFFGIRGNEVSIFWRSKLKDYGMVNLSNQKGWFGKFLILCKELQ